MRMIKFALTMVIAVAGLVFLTDQMAAAGEGIPLKALAGNYAFTTPGSYSICLNPTTFAGVDCATFSGPLVVPFTYAAVGALTRDDEGNSCGTWTEVSSVPVGKALPIFPPIVNAGTYAVGKISAYDAATGTGDISFTNYQGGTCNGSTFVKGNALETGTNTAHFAASNGGKRMDLVFTSAISFVKDTTGDVVGDFSFSSIFLKQEN